MSARMYSESGAEYSYFVLHVRAGECSYFFIFSCILIWSAGARLPRTTIVPSLVFVDDVQNILLEISFLVPTISSVTGSSL